MHPERSFLLLAGCGISEETDQFQFPGYVIADAAKERWPTFCYFAASSHDASTALSNCSSVSNHVQRLCPCAEVAGLIQQSMQVDSTTSQDSAGSSR